MTHVSILFRCEIINCDFYQDQSIMQRYHFKITKDSTLIKILTLSILQTYSYTSTSYSSTSLDQTVSLSFKCSIISLGHSRIAFTGGLETFSSNRSCVLYSFFLNALISHYIRTRGVENNKISHESHLTPTQLNVQSAIPNM